ncbi:MAG: hypothetical protein DRP29_06995 [Thermodesulfobacteriota bacterium]|nr:MAG: hypothetical protein DRP29_06995 [Thermodesulfobacteriota bacterium]
MEGKTLLVNVYNVLPDLLSSDEIAKLLLIRTIEAADMIPVLHTLQIAHFPIPVKDKGFRGEYGLSAGIVLIESHVYIHTWPEKNYMRYEMSSCKDFEEKKVLDVLKIILGNKIKIEYQAIPWRKKE